LAFLFVFTLVNILFYNLPLSLIYSGHVVCIILQRVAAVG